MLLRVVDQRVREVLKHANLDEDDELTFEDRCRICECSVSDVSNQPGSVASGPPNAAVGAAAAYSPSSAAEYVTGRPEASPDAPTTCTQRYEVPRVGEREEPEECGSWRWRE
eukprot:1535768-Prymnesium_polylepis.2